MAINKTKQAIENVVLKGARENMPLINYLRNLTFSMISHRKACGVDWELNYCKQIIDSRLGCYDDNALDYEKGLDQGIDGVTAGKRDDAISVHIDLIIGQLDKLFKIDPTAVPSLPKREQDIVVDKIEEIINQQTLTRVQEAVLGYMEQAALNGVVVSEQQAIEALRESGLQFSPTEDEVFQIAKQLKGRATKVIRKQAVAGAKRMEREIHDIVIETGYGDEILKFIDDFDSYPHALMRTGSHLPFSRRVWSGDSWKIKDEDLPVAKRVSPHNFYWSSDSLDIHDGTAVGDVVYLRRIDLERMFQFEENDDIKKNIKECVEMCNIYESWRNWLDCAGHNREQNDQHESYTPWIPGATIPCMRIHSLVDACALTEMGITSSDDLSQYEMESWLINKKLIRLKAHDPKGYTRPYVIEKFRHLPGRFQGKSLAKILQPVEHQVKSVKRNELLNIGFSSAPITVRDVTAFEDEDELPDVIEPGMNLNARGRVGKNVKPLEFYTAPNITGQLRQVLFDLYSEADVKSQIPRLLTGQGQLGSGVRSASMLATQINGASKNLKRQMWLIARNVVVPHIEILFEYYMKHGSDKKAKVDASVKVGSIEALVNREFVLQNAQGLVQYLAPYAANGLISQGVIQQLLFTILSESGITAGEDPELAEEFDNLISDASNLGSPQAQGVALDGRSDFQANTGQTLQT